MAQFELNEGLAQAGPKQGEVRNPTGWNNPMQRLRNRDIAKLLKGGGDQPCKVPGYEHLTRFQYVFGVFAWDMAEAGSKYHTTLIANRVFGRVPTTVEVNATLTKVNLTELTDDELRERARRLTQLIEGETVDAEDPKGHSR